MHTDSRGVRACAGGWKQAKGGQWGKKRHVFNIFNNKEFKYKNKIYVWKYIRIFH